MSTTTQVQTIVCKQGGEGENVFDCAIRHGFSAEDYRVATAGDEQRDGEEIAGYVKTRPNDPPYPILRRAVATKRYTITVGATLVGETSDRQEAQGFLSLAREMSRRHASHYQEPIKLTETGRTVDLLGPEGLDW